MPTNKTRVLIALALFFSLLVVACTRKPSSTAEVPPVLSHAYQVSVAPFSQPTAPSELICGNLPEPQGLISQEDLALLDGDLRAVLSKDGKRRYTFLSTPLKMASISLHHGSQPQALSQWLAYGKKQGADLLLVPMVINWHERAGSRAGVTESAEVHLEFFLLKVSSQTVMNRCIFEEKQAALAENFLNIGSFIKRRGSWVSARDLAGEGMQKAKKEFGL